MVDMKTGVKPKTDKKKAKTAVGVKKTVAKKDAIKKEVLPVTDDVLEIKHEAKVAKAGDSPSKPLAKSGKRSVKAIKEVEEKQLKEERKEKVSEAADKPKVAIKPPRSRLERAGKEYQQIAKLVEKDKQYNLKDAIELAIKTSPVKFDATVELHINLGVDPKQADQNVRGMVNLPAGTGKTLQIAVLSEDSDSEKAKKAGADIAGSEAIFKLLDAEKIDFDVLIAVPTMMAKLGKYAKILGPKGLMPNPKSGTVTADVVKAVTEAKSGRIEYRVDTAGIVHLGIGKVSFGPEKVLQNAEATLGSIRSAKPSTVKGVYLKSAYVSTTMGPPIRLVV